MNSLPPSPGFAAGARAFPFASDLTGKWASGEECDAQYWWRAIREPVLFQDAINELLAAGIADFVEIGPHPVLKTSLQELHECARRERVGIAHDPAERRRTSRDEAFAGRALHPRLQGELGHF